LRYEDLDLGSAIVVALNYPFKAKVDQRGRVDHELPGFDLDLFFRSSEDAKTQQRRQDP
jgi:hypothetical protein